MTEINPIRFDGQVALITGAARGIGHAYARLLAERGAAVVIHDVGADSDGQGSDPAIAEGAADALRRAGWQASAAHDAIDTRDGCHALVRSVLDAHGRIDVLIHNAGWVGYQSIETLEPAFLQRALALQVEAPLWLAQAAWPAMVAQEHGRILFTTSDRALYPQYALKGLSAYAASKIAQVGVMNVLALEGADHHICVNAISPVAKTRMWGVEDEPDELHPEAIAPGAVWLVSRDCRESGWVLRASNGQFHAVRPIEASGVDYPRNLRAVAADTPEAVAAAWSRIAVSEPERRSSR
ncbi:SDR family NAD(P)-dependent oxidoreductase [Sphingopyxis sp. R3-92]|uniref:SDR family NAD(P)-dependent oxidoreductase n=1 Tax=Sphingopyxis sp. R3-92 TaxID=3158553 RepID=UPI003EE52B57